jgi:hypothetical protein
MDENNTVWTVAFIIMMVWIGFLIYNMAQIKAYNPLVLFGGLLFLVSFAAQNIWGDWFTFLRAPPEFITLSGVGGRKVDGPIPLPGGRVSFRVSFNRSVLNQHIKKRRRGGFFSFLGLFAGTVILDVSGRREQFESVDARDCENPNGCIFFKGRLDGAELRNQEVMSGLAELRRVSDLYRGVVASMKLYGQQLTVLINQRHLDDEHTFSRLKSLGDHLKNVKIIAKGGGGADAIAAEMN